MAAVLYIPDPLLSSRVARGRRRTEERDEVSLTQTNRCGVETSHRACRKKMPRAPGNAFQRVVDSSHGVGALPLLRRERRTTSLSKEEEEEPEETRLRTPVR